MSQQKFCAIPPLTANSRNLGIDILPNPVCVADHLRRHRRKDRLHRGAQNSAHSDDGDGGGAVKGDDGPGGEEGGRVGRGRRRNGHGGGGRGGRGGRAQRPRERGEKCCVWARTVVGHLPWWAFASQSMSLVVLQCFLGIRKCAVCPPYQLWGKPPKDVFIIRYDVCKSIWPNIVL